ncbi:MAG TPA: hypothetical protein VF487_12545 [Chitinophagaceae bacterium]
MKKILPVQFIISLLFISNCFAQQAGEKKGWPSSERYVFISECIKTAKTGMGEDSARFYCYCMQDKIETKYPTVAEAAKITDADMQSPEMKKEISSCMYGYWTKEDREAFVSNCITSAQKGGLSEEKSKNYCECMLFKVEMKFPKTTDAKKELTPEKLSSPEWKKLIQGCLDF